MAIFVHDTRDKPGKHDNIEPVLEQMGHKIVRSKLFVGDITLLNDQHICIDLKRNLSEVETNLVHQHVRFRNECKRAQDSCIRLVILIEEPDMPALECVPDWVNPRLAQWQREKRHKCGPPINGKSLYMQMRTMQQRYGVEWLFCPRAETARRICDILGVA